MIKKITYRKIGLVFIALFFCTNSLLSQDRYQQDFPYRVSVGFNFINDSFTTNYNPFSSLAWAKHPSKITAERIVLYNLSVEGSLSYNKYDAGTIVDGIAIENDRRYYAVDGHLKYNLSDLSYNLIKLNEHIEPYIMGGLGAALYKDDYDFSDKKLTINIGGGVNFWFYTGSDYNFDRRNAYKRLGINLQVLGKAKIYDPGVVNNVSLTGNHIQYSVGMIYRFGIQGL
jgi:hypothetical protein